MNNTSITLNNTYQTFTIRKQTGTYADALEAFGVASLIDKIHSKLNWNNAKITIENKGTVYIVTSSKPIMKENIEQLPYFQVIKFIKLAEFQKKGKKNNKYIPVPNAAGADFFDYTSQKAEKDAYKLQFEKILKEKNKDLMKMQLKELIDNRNSEFGKKIDAEYDIYSQMIANPYVAFSKLYDNFDKFQNNFQILVKEILDTYSSNVVEKRSFKLSEKITAQQLFSPNQGKGLNRIKADSSNMENLDGRWITETMKIAGAFSIMFCQSVKVGSTYDLKVFVPDFNEISFSSAKKIQLEFKKYLKSVSPIKLDIINVLNYSTTFIKLSEDYKGKIKDTIGGFFSVYQKDLGQNKAVANISYLEIPTFISYKNKAEGKIWLEILEEQTKLVNAITEQGDAMQGLLAYRNFISSSDLNSFFRFCNWYSVYLMQQLSKEKYFTKPFQIETLNKFFTIMDNNGNLKLSDIITNAGFLAVAKAIRKSTVSLQYTPKANRKFDIRYGVAQQLQNKSKSKVDFIGFIGEFIGLYNAETAKFKEKNPNMATRAIVKDEELNQFYLLVDGHSPKMIGALLSSYGFALEAKEVKIDDIGDENNPDEVTN
jgi:hypothetical protein